jgi:hypothetical protein
MTKKYTRLAVLFTMLSVLLLIGPFLIYTAGALFGDALVSQKMALASTVVIVLVMTAISALNHLAMRSRLWILLIGLYCCLDNIMEPLLVIAVCQVLDELIIAPLAKRFRNQATIHAELDKRL